MNKLLCLVFLVLSQFGSGQAPTTLSKACVAEFENSLEIYFEEHVWAPEGVKTVKQTAQLRLGYVAGKTAVCWDDRCGPAAEDYRITVTTVSTRKLLRFTVMGNKWIRNK
jgi:hypothetical protein